MVGKYGRSISMLAFASWLGVFGCQEDEEEELAEGVTEIHSTFLTQANFSKPANVSSIESSVMSNFINYLPVRQDTPNGIGTGGDGSADEADSVGTCLEEKLSGVTISASGGTASFGVEIDAQSCFEGLSSGEDGVNISITEATFRIFFTIACQNGDLSALNGVSVTSENEEKAGCDDGQVTVTENNQVTFTADITGDASATMTSSNMSYTGNQAGTGGSIATFGTGSLTLSDTNLTAEANSFAITGNDFSSQEVGYYSVSPSGVSGDGSSTYFSDGSFSTTLYDWDGTITNTGQAPTYSMSNGSTSVDGTLYGFASLTDQLENTKQRASPFRSVTTKQRHHIDGLFRDLRIKLKELPHMRP